MIWRFTVKLVEFESFHQISRRSSFVHVGSDVQLLFFWWWWSWNRWGYSPWILDIQILLLQKFGEKKTPVCVILFQLRIRCFLKTLYLFFSGWKAAWPVGRNSNTFWNFHPFKLGKKWSNLTIDIFFKEVYVFHVSFVPFLCFPFEGRRGWLKPPTRWKLTKTDQRRVAWNAKSSGVEGNQLRCVRVGLHCARPGISMDEQVRQNMVDFLLRNTPGKVTWQWKIHHLKMYFRLKKLKMGISNVTLVFRGVSSYWTDVLC